MKYSTAARIVNGVAAILMLMVAFSMVSGITGSKVEAPAPRNLLPTQVARCARPPDINLEVLRAQVEALIVRHHVIMWEGGLRENDATKGLRSLVDYSQECWGVTLEDLGVSREFWRSIH